MATLPTIPWKLPKPGMEGLVSWAWELSAVRVSLGTF